MEKKASRRGRKPKKEINSGIFLIHSQTAIDSALDTKANQSDLLNLIPVQKGNENKMLITNGSATQWAQPTIVKLRIWTD